MITEDQLEQLCLDWFRAGGYEYTYGPDIAFDGDMPERSDYLQVVLTGRLLTALQKINPHIPLATLEEAALAVTKPESPVLIHNSRKVSPQICFENSRKSSIYFYKIIWSNILQTTNNKILSRIYGRGRGWAFTPNDFISGFDRKQIDNALSDLSKEGKIRRICRGMYDYPKYSELLSQELSPDHEQVAQAFARKFNWRILPSGDAALNLLGLSTQIPGRFIYLSDGPNRKYSILSYQLEFKKTALKEIGFKHRESGLIVQALKALGKERITSKVIEKIRKQIAPEKYGKILQETKTVTGWVYDAMKQICREG